MQIPGCFETGRSALATGLLIAASGCASLSPAVPDGYSGPVAVVKDSVRTFSERKADFFYLSEIDGRTIEDSRLRTLKVNQGRGLNMTPAVVERNVPAQKATFTLVGRTEYAAPILTLTNTVYQVTGKVTFTPETYRSYVVRGELGESYSAVWIEDEITGKAVGNRIEIHGPAKLGVLEK